MNEQKEECSGPLFWVRDASRGWSLCVQQERDVKPFSRINVDTEGDGEKGETGEATSARASMEVDSDSNKALPQMVKKMVYVSYFDEEDVVMREDDAEQLLDAKSSAAAKKMARLRKWRSSPTVLKLPEERSRKVVVPVDKKKKQLENYSDALKMPGFNEPALLDLLRRRFEDQQICTMLGNVAIAINPYEYLTGRKGIGHEFFENWALGCANSNPEAHLHCIADEAYDALMTGPVRSSQSILVNGESGAGKTEASKFILRCLAKRSEKAREKAVEDQKEKVDEYFGRMGLFSGSVAGKATSAILLARRGGGKRGHGRGAAKFPPHGSPRNSLASAKSDNSSTSSGINAKLTSEVERNMVSVNPIFEAFGNAVTEHNDNSSRFGKYLQLDFDKNGILVSAHTRHFLLEKARITHHRENHRSFHIFYQLLAFLRDDSFDGDEDVWSSDVSEDEEGGEESGKDDKNSHTMNKKIMELPVELCSPKYNYLHPDASFSDLGSKASSDDEDDDEIAFFRDEDTASFKVTRSAFEEIGIKKLERRDIWMMLLIVLEIGNISFLEKLQQNGLDGCCIDMETVSSKKAFETIASYIQVDSDVLERSLCFRTVKAGGVRRSSLSRHPLTVQEARESRDGLAKALYTALFDFVVSTVNSKIGIVNAKAAAHIGIVDVFGFEDLKVNSFEQLCINYSNEKLQDIFEQQLKRTEKELFEDEGLSVEKDMVEFEDNHAVIEALEQKPNGLFPVLDQSSTLHTTDEAFIKSIFRESVGSRRITAPRVGGTLSFEVKHHAGAVVYNARHMVMKNTDALQADVADLLLQSPNAFLSRLFEESTTSESSKLTSNTAAKDEQAESKKPSVGGRIHSVRASFEGAKLKATRTLASGKTIGNLFRKQLQYLHETMLATNLHFIRCIKPNHEKKPRKWNGALVLNQLRYLSLLEVVKVRSEGFSLRFLHEHFLHKFRALDVSLCRSKRTDNGNSKKCKYIMERIIQDRNLWRLGSSRVFIHQSALMFLERAERVSHLAAIIFLQRALRKHLIGHVRVEHGAASKIESIVRSYLVLRKFKVSKSAAILIAAHWRGFAQRREVFAIRNAVIAVQSAVRMWRKRYRLMHYRRLVVKMQSCVRMFFAKLALKALAAKRIQSFFRRRQRQRREKRGSLAALRLQAAFRGRGVRYAVNAVKEKRIPFAHLLKPNEAVVVLSRCLSKSKEFGKFKKPPPFLLLTTSTRMRVLLVNGDELLSSHEWDSRSTLFAPTPKDLNFSFGDGTVLRLKQLDGSAEPWLDALQRRTTAMDLVFPSVNKPNLIASGYVRVRFGLPKRASLSPSASWRLLHCEMRGVVACFREARGGNVEAALVVNESSKALLEESKQKTWKKIGIRFGPDSDSTLSFRLDSEHKVQTWIAAFREAAIEAKLVEETLYAPENVHSQEVVNTNWITEMKAKGNNYFNYKRYMEAIACYNKVLLNTRYDIADEEVRACLNNRAVCHLRMGSFRACVEDASTVLSVDSENAKAHLRKGLALLELEQYEGALESVNRAIELNPDLPQVREAQALLNEVSANKRSCLKPLRQKSKSLKNKKKGFVTRLTYFERIKSESHKWEDYDLENGSDSSSGAQNEINGEVEDNEDRNLRSGIALYEYVGDGENLLRFSAGERIQAIVGEENDEWLEGTNVRGERGKFPAVFLKFTSS